MALPGMGGDRDPAVTVGIQGDASGFNRASDSVLAGLSSIKARAGLAAGALAALGGVIANEVVTSAREYNATIRELTKVTDPTQAQQIGEDMQNLSERIPLATTRLNELATQAARFGVEGSANIRNFVETVSEMAVATNLSTTEAGESFARLSTLTGTPISDIRNLGSAINTLGQTSATSAADIVDGMLRSSGALTQLGLSAEEIVGLQATLNETSASARNAGRRLRRLAQSLMDPGRAEKIAEALGMTADEFQNLVQNDPRNVIMRLAGVMNQGGEAAERLRSNLTSVSQQALTGLASNLENTTGNVERANQSFEEGTSLSREFGIEADSLTSRIQILQNRLFNLSQDVGQELIPGLKTATDTAIAGVDAFNQLNQASDGLAAQLTILAGTAVSTGGVLSWAFGLGTGGPVALGIAGAGALAIAWERNLFDIRDTTSDAVDWVGEEFGGLMDWLPVKTSWSLGRSSELWEDWSLIVQFWIDAIIVGLQNLYDAAVLSGKTLKNTFDVALAGASAGLDPLGIFSNNVAEEAQFVRDQLEDTWDDIETTGDNFGNRLQNFRQRVETLRSQAQDLTRSDFDIMMGRSANDIPFEDSGGPGGPDRAERTPLETLQQRAGTLMDGVSSLLQSGMSGPGATTPRGAMAMTDPVQNSLLENQNRMLDEVRQNTGPSGAIVEGLLGPFEEVPQPCRDTSRANSGGSAPNAPQDPSQAGLPPGMSRQEFREARGTGRQRSTYGSLPGGSAAHGPGSLSAAELERAIENSLNVQAEVTLDGKRVTDELEEADTRFRKRRLIE